MKYSLLASSLIVAFAGTADAQISQKPKPLNKQQLGAFSAASSSSTTMTFGAGTSDDCAAPTAIMGQGAFAYDNLAATTGTEGQNESLCFFFGNSGIDNDVWFEWTADISGTATIQTCGSADDTKMAVYPGGGCPTDGSALACNDDDCGLQSLVSLDVTGGTSYLIQVGNFPGVTPSAPGTVTIDIVGAPTGGDDCAAPSLISGQGAFAFDNTLATTGAEGQNETLCFFFGSSGVDNDVWFEWTADATGTATLQTCGSTDDSKMAVYPAGGCPADGTALACNDDDCGLQSLVQIPVTSGTAYLIQVGNFPGVAAANPGTLTIDIAGMATNDDCATPDMLMGQGNFAYDNSAATTGAEGQNETLCDFFGSTGVDNDVWFEWTADEDGDATIDTCGSGPDTKLALYPAGGCPADGSAIACNDDDCGLQSSITLPVLAGETYLIQAGNFPGTAGGASTLNIDIEAPAAPPSCYDYDDGSSENGIGLTAGGEILWLHRFVAIGGNDVINEISTAYNTIAGTGLTATVVIYDDPTNDGDPSDLVLVHSQTEVSANENSDTLNAYSIPSVAVSGEFYVGVLLPNAVGDFPAPLDQSQTSSGRAFVAGAIAPNTLDINNLGAADLPPADVDALGLPGVWLLRAVGANCPIGTNYCTSNAAIISASGSVSVAANDLVLSATPVPDGENGVFFYGPLQVAVPFGNGTRCVGGGSTGIARLPIEVATGGTLTHAVDNTVPPFLAVAITAGSTWNFQAWFRDTAGGGAFFDLSDGLELIFQP